jgi:hypothetical protein
MRSILSGRKESNKRQMGSRSGYVRHPKARDALIPI